MMAMATFLVSCAVAGAQPQGVLEPALLRTSFESDLDGWQLILNRGALAEAVVDTTTAALGGASLRVTPIRACAPDDRAGSTNIHLRYETLTLQADTDYVMSAWVKAAQPTTVQLRVRRMSIERKAGEGILSVGKQWQRLQIAFRVDEDWDDAAPQVILGDSPGDIWVDGVVVREASATELGRADYLLVGEQAVAPSSGTVRLRTEFQSGLGGWRMVLNRGAEATVLPDDHDTEDLSAITVTPTALSAADDLSYPTNIHLRYETIAIRAGQEYRFSVRARSDAPRTMGVRIMPLGSGASLQTQTFEITDQWQTLEWTFTPEADMPDAVAQIQAGGDEHPLWIDWVEIARTDIDGLDAGDYIVRGDEWIEPLPWAGDGDGWLKSYRPLGPELPEQFEMGLSARPFAGSGLGVALVGETGAVGPALAIEVRGATAELVRRQGDAREVLSSYDLPAELLGDGDALPVMITREDGPIVIRLAESLTVTIPADAETFSRLHLGTLAAGGAMELLAAEGYELLAHRVDGATEKLEYRDPETGRRIVRLTRSPYHDKHAYYDISPWSPDGSQIVFCSAEPGQKASAVWVMDADGTNMRKVGESTTFGMHTGNFPIWAPDGQSIYYRTHLPNDDGTRSSGTARVWLDTGRTELIRLAPRQISWETGRLLLMENKADGERERGLYSAAPDGSDLKLLALTEEIMALSPSRDRHDQSPKIGLTNCKWSPDGKRAMVVLLGYDARDRQNIKEIYIVNADGSDLHFVMTFVHHHIWHPNSQQVIGNCADGLYIVNWDGTGQRKITDLAQGHPSFSPDGSTIATDCYGGEYSDSLVLIDVATGEVEKLCNAPTVHGRSHETGTHPHPYWSPDGKSLIYDSDETGHCQLYQVFVED